MRTGYSAANVAQFSFHKSLGARRDRGTRGMDMTCLVLVRHHQTDKAIKVSDTGDGAKAVWIPKSMVVIEQPSARGILVASMPKAFAEQKRLSEKLIDPALFNAATREVLAEAVARAARKRNHYRGHRSPNGRGMTQNAFC